MHCRRIKSNSLKFGPTTICTCTKFGYSITCIHPRAQSTKKEIYLIYLVLLYPCFIVGSPTHLLVQCLLHFLLLALVEVSDGLSCCLRRLELVLQTLDESASPWMPAFLASMHRCNRDSLLLNCDNSSSCDLSITSCLNIFRLYILR